jgi:hypothetical protein
MTDIFLDFMASNIRNGASMRNRRIRFAICRS